MNRRKFLFIDSNYVIIIGTVLLKQKFPLIPTASIDSQISNNGYPLTYLIIFVIREIYVTALVFPDISSVTMTITINNAIVSNFNINWILSSLTWPICNFDWNNSQAIKNRSNSYTKRLFWLRSSNRWFLWNNKI